MQYYLCNINARIHIAPPYKACARYMTGRRPLNNSSQPFHLILSCRPALVSALAGLEAV